MTADRPNAIRFRSAKDTGTSRVDDDPLFRRRTELTFATAVKFNDDFVLYDEIITDLHEIGEHVRAVRLRVLVGELMTAETTAFQDRYGWSLASHTQTLTREIAAHLPARLPVVNDTFGSW